jgi:hypothetical protein
MAAHVDPVRARARAVAAGAARRGVGEHRLAVVGGAQPEPVRAPGQRELGQPADRDGGHAVGQLQLVLGRAQRPARTIRHQPLGRRAGKERIERRGERRHVGREERGQQHAAQAQQRGQRRRGLPRRGRKAVRREQPRRRRAVRQPVLRARRPRSRVHQRRGERRAVHRRSHAFQPTPASS